jgi:hypothetical protein
MIVGELIALLKECDPNLLVNFVSEEGNYLDIGFVENRLKSPNGWDAVISLYEFMPDWCTSESYEVEQISGDYVFAITKYHDNSSNCRATR